VAAGVLMLGVSAPFVVQGVTAAVRAGQDSLASVRETLVTFGAPAQQSEATALFVLFAVVLLVASGLGVLVAVGVLLRRSWAREGALGLFGIFALLALASGLRGVTAEPPARNAGWAILVAAVDIAVVVLLLHPLTSRDFQVAEMRRGRKRAGRRAQVGRAG
jgi:hypothetical protein